MRPDDHVQEYRETPDDLDHYRSYWDDFKDTMSAVGRRVGRPAARLGAGTAIFTVGAALLGALGWLSWMVIVFFGASTSERMYADCYDGTCTVGGFIGYSVLSGLVTALVAVVAGLCVIGIYAAGSWLIEDVL